MRKELENQLKEEQDFTEEDVQEAVKNIKEVVEPYSEFINEITKNFSLEEKAMFLENDCKNIDPRISIAAKILYHKLTGKFYEENNNKSN